MRNALVIGKMVPVWFLVAAVAACGGDNGSGEDTDTGTTDTGMNDTAADTTTPDVTDEPDTGGEDVADVAEDVTEDVVDEEVSEADVADASDATDASDASDIEVIEVDAGVDCTGRPDLCEDPYLCINQVCRLPVGGTVWAENGFTIAEPEELTEIFDILKTFASDVSYMVLDIEDGPDRTVRPAVYGAADRITIMPSEFEYEWQYPEELGQITFRPFENPDEPLDGDQWISDEFQYDLNARIVFDGAMFTVGLDAEEARIRLNLEPDYMVAEAQMEGVLTRLEAESRFMQSVDDFEPFVALVCTNTAFEPADPLRGWYLSDVLDCNDTPMDIDFDEDGENDSYYTRVEARFQPAVVNFPEAMP